MGVVVGYLHATIPVKSIHTALRQIKCNLIDTMTTLTYNISIALITLVYIIWCSIRYTLNCI